MTELLSKWFILFIVAILQLNLSHFNGFSEAYSLISIKNTKTSNYFTTQNLKLQTLSKQPLLCNNNRLNLQSDTKLSMMSTDLPATSKIYRLNKLIKNIWNFSRPHTMIGSFISLLTIYMYATPFHQWLSKNFVQSVMCAVIPSILMNLYITGLNQLTDVDIDIISKPYLPIASGDISHRRGTIIVVLSMLLSFGFTKFTNIFVKMCVFGSFILGTLYSLPPFRLKRFPLLAALCILIVRGSLINLGFYFGAKIDNKTLLFVPNSLYLVIKNMFLDPKTILATVTNSIKMHPDIYLITLFFAIYGVVIALLKDVPDTEGDKYGGNINSFSVQLGPTKMFK